MKPLQRILVGICLLVCFGAHGQIITTVAGNGMASGALGDGGPATAARLGLQAYVAFDTAGNMYIADGNNNRVRKVDFATNIITTVAGTGVAGYNGDGIPATSAQLNIPSEVAFDRLNNLYIGEGGSCRVRKVDLSTGLISTFCGTGTCGYSPNGTPATSANILGGLFAFDTSNIFYDADNDGLGISYIRKIDALGIFGTIGGLGPYGCSGDGGAATNAKIQAFGICTNRKGDVFFTDRSASVRKIDIVTGIITRVAGTSDSITSPFIDGGQATATHIDPFNITIDDKDNLYIADYNNNRIEKVGTDGIIHSIAGTGVAGFSGDNGPATAAQIFKPEGVALDKCGNVYIADYNNKRIRKITLNPNCWPLAVDDAQQNKTLAIYPNPAINTLHIDNLKAPATYTLYDITGRVVATSQLTTGQNEINTTHLSTGIYLLYLLHNDGTREVHKIVKE